MLATVARAWRSHVDFSCPDCGRLRVECDEHADESHHCITCDSDTRLVGVGGPVVGNAKWYRCLSCGQLHMLRRGEFVKTGERSGTEEFGQLASLD
jgi:predicted RNA-binding Zn-ribbon protein involved in translation (DUF1610 family)